MIAAKKKKKEEPVQLTEEQKLQLELSQQAGRYLTIFRASALGRTGDINACVTRGVKKIDAKEDLTGQTALILAAQAGSRDAIQQLILAGAKVNGKGLGGMTALHWACKNDAFDAAQYLLEEAKSGTETEDDAGNTPLHFAAMGGYIRLLDLLIKSGANLHHRNKQQASILMAAVLSGQSAALSILIKTHDLLDLTDAQGNTALHLAASSGQENLARILTQAGASNTITNAAGELARNVAVGDSLIKLLSASPAAGRPVSSQPASSTAPASAAAASATAAPGPASAPAPTPAASSAHPAPAPATATPVEPTAEQKA